MPLARRSVIDPGQESLESAALVQAVTFARKQGQLVLWDRSSRPYAIASYDEESKRLRALTDEEAGTILNQDAGIAREWRRFNGMTGNQGSLIVIDADRVSRVLKQTNEEPEDEGHMRGLA